ncbi:MAG: hypothetical protein AAF790_09905 [Planctomycetota bacterium]
MASRNPTAIFAALLVACVASGCQSLGGQREFTLAEKLDIPNGVPWKADKPPQPGTPSRIAATWTDAVRQQPGKGAERGFGGRLYFYGAKDVEPIAVEGQLVVYAFDETGREPTDNRPSRRFVFPAEQFVKHQSESEFGVSYSVWLPWGDVNGPTADVSLIARFEPLTGGSLVVSEQATSRLPGLLGEPLGVSRTSVERSELKPAIQQASHQQGPGPAAGRDGAIPPAEPSGRRMETTSIQLPGSRGGRPAWQAEVSYPAPAGSGRRAPVAR